MMTLSRPYRYYLSILWPDHLIHLPHEDPNSSKLWEVQLWPGENEPTAAVVSPLKPGTNDGYTNSCASWISCPSHDPSTVEVANASLLFYRFEGAKAPCPSCDSMCFPRHADSISLPPEFRLMIRGKLQIVKRPGHPLSKGEILCKMQIAVPLGLTSADVSSMWAINTYW